jgi:hypothetical protein
MKLLGIIEKHPDLKITIRKIRGFWNVMFLYWDKNLNVPASLQQENLALAQQPLPAFYTSTPPLRAISFVQMVQRVI